MIGLSISAPVGPIGILCIRRTLVAGRLTGFVSGLGAATADAFYGAIAAFGLTFLSDVLIEHALWLTLIGGAFLFYLGLKTLYTPVLSSSVNAPVQTIGLAGAYLSTFFLTITNPITILAFAAIFAGVGVVQVEGALAPLVVVVGVFSGSALWWLTLSGGISWLWLRLPPPGRARLLVWINRFSGAVLMTFAVGLLASAVL